MRKSEETIQGVLVVGHGSRREEANDDVREAARRIGEVGGFPLVAAAFLEIERPSILEAFSQLVKQGAGHVTVHPYFLSPGRHTRGDIPVEVREAADLFPSVGYNITEPLCAHRLVIQASVERIREAGDESCAWPGVAYLVGAGPGDPGLLTVRARDLLVSCDTVIYDNLVNPDILRHVPVEAERIYAGKVGHGRQTPQDEINRMLVEHALNGRRVVRLKGGDPLLFGRGGEEADALGSAGIPFEIVPGVSSALAVPAYAGIPLTHRGLSSSVAVLTGARGGDGAAFSETLKNLSGADTVVVLMGVAHLREIAGEMIESGRSPETPVAVIRWGTYDGQQTVTGSLLTIADEVERGGLRAPAVIVIGEVVNLRERLDWFETHSAEELDAALAEAL
jgi:uroporphyrin-III C-methyltransferase